MTNSKLDFQIFQTELGNWGIHKVTSNGRFLVDIGTSLQDALDYFTDDVRADVNVYHKSGQQEYFYFG